jgi:hypothetical protein
MTQQLRPFVVLAVASMLSAAARLPMNKWSKSA